MKPNEARYEVSLEPDGEQVFGNLIVEGKGEGADEIAAVFCDNPAMLARLQEVDTAVIDLAENAIYWGKTLDGDKS